MSSLSNIAMATATVAGIGAAALTWRAGNDEIHDAIREESDDAPRNQKLWQTSAMLGIGGIGAAAGGTRLLVSASRQSLPSSAVIGAAFIGAGIGAAAAGSMGAFVAAASNSREMR